MAVYRRCPATDNSAVTPPGGGKAVRIWIDLNVEALDVGDAEDREELPRGPLVSRYAGLPRRSQ